MSTILRSALSLPLVATLAVGLTVAPALAAVPSPVAPAQNQVVPPHHPPISLKPHPVNPAWDGILKSTIAKLKPGMNNDDVTKLFQKAATEKHGLPVVFDVVGVEEFQVPSVKKRVTVQLAYFRTDNARTKQAAVLAFESPQGDFRGASAKLVKISTTNEPTPSIAQLQGMRPVTVNSTGEFAQKSHYHFGG